MKSKDNEPDKVLIRIYGDAAATGDELLQETVVVSLLGEKMLAPKVYGFFQGGRFEQFLQVKEDLISTKEE